MTARSLQTAERRYQAALQRATEARADRDRIVHQAIADGWTYRQIAATMGISYGRVSQIEKGSR